MFSQIVSLIIAKYVGVGTDFVDGDSVICVVDVEFDVEKLEIWVIMSDTIIK